MELKKIYNSKETCDKKGRIYYFDNLKFILIFFVVTAHFIELCKKSTDIVKTIILFIYSFHMPLFVFVTGMFAKKQIEKKEKGKIVLLVFFSIFFSFTLFLIRRIIYHDNMYFSLYKVNSAPWYIFAMAVWYAVTMGFSNFNKKYILIFSIFLALIVGYDPKIGDLFSLSRIIVFYPFFLLGFLCDKKTMEKISNHSVINKVISIFFLISVFVVLYFTINNTYFMRAMFTGRNSYYSLPENLQNFGFFIRLLAYIITSVMGFAILQIIPKGKTIFTKFGTRTMAVYVFHVILYFILVYEGVRLRTYKLLLLSLLVTLIFSLKIFSIPFDKFFHLDFKKKSKKVKLSYEHGSKIINIVMIIVMLLFIGYFLTGR